MSRAAGVDVGVRKGCDVVVLDDREVVAHHPALQPSDLPDLLETHRVDVVAIDSPPAYRVSEQARVCERDLLACGIRSYSTPTERAGAGHAFYEWMRVGFACFTAIDGAFPRYRTGSYRGHALEVFPHASAVTLHGCLWPQGTHRRVRTKREWRRASLEAAGVDTTELHTLDAIDAGLAALTGVIALSGGATNVGDDEDGPIVVPVARLLQNYVRTR